MSTLSQSEQSLYDRVVATMNLRSCASLLFLFSALVACGGGNHPLDVAPVDATDAATPTDIGFDAVIPDADAAPFCVRSDLPPTTWLRDPPVLPSYSHGTCPVLRAGQTADTSLNDNFSTSTQNRAFYLLVPSYYSPDHPLPMVIGWHWLAGNASQLIHEGQIEAAVEQMGFIAVIPEALHNPDGGILTYGFDWPFLETAGQPAELTFFDDMLACVTQQYRVDPRRIHGVGVSAGALWLTYLSTTTHVNYLASIASLSGGLGQEPHILNMRFAPQDNKFPALVLWGGPTDHFVINFEQASEMYRDALRCDHHFVMQCIHDAGHAVPPLPYPDGGTRFESIWQFMLDHPYGLGPDQSPYLDGGLPSIMPPWCNVVP